MINPFRIRLPAMDIAIDGRPPTQEVIEGWRAALAKEKGRQRSLWAIVVLVLVLVLVYGWLGGGAAFVVALALAVATAVGVAYAELVEAQATLNPASADDCLSIARWSDEDPVVDAYRAAVVGQGRQILVAEVRAMKDWVEGKSARAAKEERRIEVEQACRKVYEVNEAG